MQPQAPISPEQAKVSNTLTTTQSGERTVFSIRRHPIGIIGMYVGAGLVLVVAAVLCFVAPSAMNTTLSSQTSRAIDAGFLVVALIDLVVVMISTKVYWGNQWVLTTDSITQINQNSLFSRQSSQLSLGNLEDVTAEQNGILTHMFNYGLLKVETAGERSKFSFAYCPNPNFYAQQILQAREAFEQGLAEREGYAVTRMPQQVPYQTQAPAQPTPPITPPPVPAAEPPQQAQAPIPYPATQPGPYIPPSDESGGVNINSQQ
ncbi:MAG TPA: hypothetical protein VG604_04525 [Candidatus Saccharimonadales bacterium]|nr:hypothetical protein [Candidatus Saccharimonadales bacterium]